MTSGCLEAWPSWGLPGAFRFCSVCLHERVWSGGGARLGAHALPPLLGFAGVARGPGGMAPAVADTDARIPQSKTPRASSQDGVRPMGQPGVGLAGLGGSLSSSPPYPPGLLRFSPHLSPCAMSGSITWGGAGSAPLEPLD